MPFIGGFQASDIGQIGIDDMSWWESGIETIIEGIWGFGIGGQSPFDFDIFQDVGIFSPPVYVPPVISEVPRTWEELEELDPELFEPILETRPDHEPDPYPFDTDVEPDIIYVDPTIVLGDPVDTDPTPEQGEEEDMSHDWGHVARDFITGYFAPDAVAPGNSLAPPVLPGTDMTAPATAANGGDCDGMRWSGGVPPKGYKVVNSCGVGVLRKVRRRRRRRLLTASDSRDIATIVGLVGKGQMASSLINRR
jgi:hypothetical protein